MNEFLQGFARIIADDAARIKEESFAEDEDFEPALFMGWPGEEPPTHVNLKAVTDHPTDAIWIIATGMSLLDHERPIWAISVADSFLSETNLPEEVVEKLSHRGSLAEARAAGDPTVRESIVLLIATPDEIGIVNMIYESGPDGITWQDDVIDVHVQPAGDPEGDMYDALRCLLTGEGTPRIVPIFDV